MNLTDDEFSALKSAKSEVEWNAICDRVKEARDGRYPGDWFVKMNLSGLMHNIQLGWKK